MSSLEELRPTGSSVSGWVFGYWGVSGEGLQVHIEMTSCRHTEVIYHSSYGRSRNIGLYNVKSILTDNSI